jgi:shikimate dehydrogenase
MIRGTTTLIAHLGYPTEAFKAPMIYNPYFESAGIDAVVVPMGVKAEDYPEVLAALFRLTNIRGALVTMPHKVTTVALLDEVTTTVRIAGSCNAVLRRPDGTLLGDMFDGAGFVRGVERKGLPVAGRKALVIGSGGVGSAIAASLAAAGLAGIGLFDMSPDAAGRWAGGYASTIQSSK